METKVAMITGGGPNMSGNFGGQDERTFIERIRQSQRARNGASPLEAYPMVHAGDERTHIGGNVSDNGHADENKANENVNGKFNGENAHVNNGEIEEYEERVQLFTLALEGIGGKVRRATTVHDAYVAVVRELQSQGICHVLIGSDWPKGSGRSFESMLQETGIRFDRWGELAFDYDSRQREVEHVDRWEAGIDWADFGVAEHGSIAIIASERQSRSVSLLPPVHIALLPGERLLTRRRSVLAQVAQDQKSGDRPLSLTFITGPSRSSDIEMDLSIGVHGPGETIVVVIDPPSVD